MYTLNIEAQNDLLIALADAVVAASQIITKSGGATSKNLLDAATRVGAALKALRDDAAREIEHVESVQIEVPIRTTVNFGGTVENVEALKFSGGVMSEIVTSRPTESIEASGAPYPIPEDAIQAAIASNPTAAGL